jgi:hypothetical protein
MKNRKIVSLFMMSLLLIGLSACTNSSTNDKGIVDFLLVQNAEEIQMSDGVLRLINVEPETLFFSDRPDRVAGRFSNKEYINHWSVGNNNFREDPPNAVLAILSDPQPQDIVVELSHPRMEDRDLVYDVKVIDGPDNALGGASALFIDVVGMPLTPLSVAGVHRRAVRRVIY